MKLVEHRNIKPIPGVITSIARIKEGTIKVKVTKFTFHSKYQINQRRTKNYAVDCEKNANFSLGAKVFIAECKPVSKTKYYRIVECQKD